MSDLLSFRDVIELWGAKDAHGARLAMGSEVGASAWTVAKWWQRNWVPPEYWSRIVETDKAKGAGVTTDLLSRFASCRIVDEARAC